jgi:4-carboxymuconolactone decarboxylase
MKKVFFFTILAFAFIATQALSQDTPIFPKGEISTADNHTGTVWLTELNGADSTFNYSIAVATFAPNAKLDWHKHPGGQILLATAGTGYYQEKGKSKQIVHKGDVIKCLPNVEHWHSATPTTDFTYLATTPTQKGKTVWLKRVTDEEYNQNPIHSTGMKSTTAEQEIIKLSKDKWQWMADKNVDALTKLFDENAKFVHMGGTWGKDRELEIIKSGFIHYKKADIHEVLSPIVIGNTVILLNRITLTAVVANNEVSNPFMVTEVYVKVGNEWKMGSLSFSKLMAP